MRKLTQTDASQSPARTLIAEQRHILGSCQGVWKEPLHREETRDVPVPQLDRGSAKEDGRAATQLQGSSDVLAQAG